MVRRSRVLVAPRSRGVHRAGAPGALAGVTLRPEPTVLDTRNVAQSAGNGLLTAMSLRLRVQEPTIRTRKPKLRAWGLSLNGKRVRFLGFVEATDQEAAESAKWMNSASAANNAGDLWCRNYREKSELPAVSALNLNDEQRSEPSDCIPPRSERNERRSFALNSPEALRRTVYHSLVTANCRGSSPTVRAAWRPA